ncbi:MAG: Trp family transcriptional regulator [Patescibacteria group bacterium]
MGRTYLPPEKRVDKTPSYLKADITFDLVNAFGLVKNPTEAALLLQDILTEKEFTNLGKRLRIAKELLSGAKHEQIIEDYHCGFSLISNKGGWKMEERA